MYEKLINYCFDILYNLTPRTLLSKKEQEILRKLHFTNKHSFSHEGEDIILDGYLGKLEKGFYVDVGAHHPQRFSNTNMFYERGWYGINIDATPGSMKIFDQLRPRDINLEIAISNSKESINFHVFNESALNSFDKEKSLRIDAAKNDYRIEKTIKIRPLSLTEILDKHLPQNTYIDFISIDTEGHDFDVIKSLDFNRFRPHYFLIEDLESTLESSWKLPIHLYMNTKGYELICRTKSTLFFRDNR